jgi:hypothetical protein
MKASVLLFAPQIGIPMYFIVVWCFPVQDDHSALAGSKLALEGPNGSRSFQRSLLRATTVATWNTVYLKHLTVLAPL